MGSVGGHIEGVARVFASAQQKESRDRERDQTSDSKASKSKHGTMHRFQDTSAACKKIR